MVAVLQLMALALLGSGLVWGAMKVWRFYEDDGRGGSGSQTRPSVWGQVVMALLGLILVIVLFTGGAATVKPTEIGVVENSFNGQMYALSPGTHIWPFSRYVIPIVTRVTIYSTKDQIIEIGETPAGAKPPTGLTETQAFGVPSSSNSPGQPVVYFKARGWAKVNPQYVIWLHRKYGANYLTNWVEQNWVSTLKAAQGRHIYDYAKENRVALENEVETQLQDQLKIVIPEAEEPVALVLVSQLAIMDYDYEPDTNQSLKAIAQKEWDRQQADRQIEVNRKQQEAESISADTQYIVTKRAAEAEQAKRIAEAQGQADALKLVADAEAYQIKVKYNAEATGIEQVQAALAASPTGFLQYQINTRWNGQLPMYMLGSTPLPFMNIPMSTAVLTDTVK